MFFLSYFSIKKTLFVEIASTNSSLILLANVNYVKCYSDKMAMEINYNDKVYDITDTTE